MTKHALLLVALAACTDEHDLGSTHTPRVARWTVAIPVDVENGVTSSANASHVAIDPAGDVVAMGSFRGTVNFGHTILTSSSNDNDDSWIGMRAGADGGELWTIGLHGGSVFLADMAVDAAGDIYIAGSYGDSLQLGPFTLSAPSEGDAFIAKLTPDGTFAWAHDLPRTGATDHIPRWLAVAPDGGAYMLGIFEGDIDFPSGSVTNTTNPCQNGAGFGCFLVAYDADGKLAWGQAETLGGPIAITDDGLVLVVVPKSSMTFGGTPIDLTHDGDLVVTNIAPDGTFTSVRPVGQPGVLEGEVQVARNTSNGIVIAATAQPDGSQPSDTLVGAGGAQQWSAGPITGDITEGIVATGGGNIYTAGHIADGSVDFGDGNHVGSLYLTTRTADGTLAGVDTYGDPGAVSQFGALAATSDGTLVFSASVASEVDFGNGLVADSMVIGLMPP